MIAFSRNVPQIALTFGKYSTSGPIQLLTFFLEEERNGRGGSEGLQCSEKELFSSTAPGSGDLWPLLPETQVHWLPGLHLPGNVGCGRGREELR